MKNDLYNEDTGDICKDVCYLSFTCEPGPVYIRLPVLGDSRHGLGYAVQPRSTERGAFAASQRSHFSLGACEAYGRHNMKEGQWNVLLALLQLDMLVNQTSARKINKALETLPQKLNKTFGNAIERATSQLAENSILAKCVISWIFFAKRLLQTSELREALAVESGDTCLDLSGLHEVELLLGIYCGLVSIDEQDGTIRLVLLFTPTVLGCLLGSTMAGRRENCCNELP